MFWRVGFAFIAIRLDEIFQIYLVWLFFISTFFAAFCIQIRLWYLGHSPGLILFVTINLICYFKLQNFQLIWIIRFVFDMSVFTMWLCDHWQVILKVVRCPAFRFYISFYTLALVWELAPQFNLLENLPFIY